MSAPRHRKPCKVDGCPSLVHVHGMCQSHARMVRLYGDPLIKPEEMPMVQSLRRLLGLPATGPTPEQMAAWADQEEWSM